MSGNKDDWQFARFMKELKIGDTLNPEKFYEMALNQRENKRKMYEAAMNAALENILMWERMARADGFGIEMLTCAYRGNVHQVVHHEEGTVEFVQAYGVHVTDERQRSGKE